MSSSDEQAKNTMVRGVLHEVPPPRIVPKPVVPPAPDTKPDNPSVPTVGLTDPVETNLYADITPPPLQGPTYTPNDPLYSSQWHFPQLGNITDVWNDYTGASIDVGVYDDGLDHGHSDLAANYDDSLHFVYDGTIYDPDPISSADGHGTAVGGLIGAVGDNNLGVSGGGFEADLTGVNYLEDIQVFPSNLNWNNNADREWYIDRMQTSFEWAANFDIMNNSWGSAGLYDTSYVFWDNLTIDAFEEVHQTGRGNLGTIVAQAAGNDNMNASGDAVNASRYTMTIAATDSNGDAESYTNWGAGTLIAAPAAGVTTDVSGTGGYNSSSGAAGDYTTTFNGTSAATPVTSGVLSLILEANDNLGWRDVHNILAESASLTGSNYGAPASNYEDSSWGNTGSSNWNGGGHAFHLSYGYGMVNALAAVRMAEAWGSFYAAPYTSTNEVTASGSYSGSSQSIPDNGSIDLSATVSTDIEVETAVVNVNLQHSDSADLTLTLISPNGAEIPLFDQEIAYHYYEYGIYNGEDLYPWANSNVIRFFDTTTSWQFEVTGLRGYDSAGTWTLRAGDVEADTSADTGSVNSYSIDFFGASLSANDVHTLTTDYLTLKAVESGRGALSDSNGGTDWLNAVAIFGDMTVDLGSSVSVSGVSWASMDGSIENIATGDGGDSITGTAAANEILAGRGDDTINGLGGDDEIDGQAGDDIIIHSDGENTYIGGDGTDVLSLPSQTSASVAWSLDSNDQLILTDNGSASLVAISIESIAFSDQTLTYAQAYDLASNGNSAPVFTSGTTASFAENGTGIAYTATATDADNETLSFDLVGGADQSSFSIGSADGELTFNSPPDFDNPGSQNGDNDYHVDVRVGDGNGGTATQTVTVSVTDVDDGVSNAAPVFTSASSATFAENGTGVAYTASATDADNDTLSYALVGGADQSDFALDPNSGELTFNAAPDFEALASVDGDNDYHVDIRASDGNGGTATQSVTINVTDVAENSTPVFSSGTSASFAENGTGVAYTAAATDGDGDTLTFALVGGADQIAFSLDPNSGELSFNTAPDYESPASADNDNDYHVDIRISDGNGGTATQSVTISVTDVDESAAPTQVVYDGVTYELITELRSFDEAELYAHAQDGYLAILSDAGEAAAVTAMVDNWFQQNPDAYNISYANDGALAAYVWAGGGDFLSEGEWIWSNGAPLDDGYTNWGGSSQTSAGQPDNAGNAQDALGIAMEDWPWQSANPDGAVGEWNDLNEYNLLYFVIEMGNDWEIETAGDVDLRSIGFQGYEIEASGGSALTLQTSSGAMLPRTKELTQAEDDGGSGYIALAQQSNSQGAVSYSVLYFDSTGTESGRPTMIGRSQSALIDWEDDFEADLNGDSIIGHTYTVIENIGDVVLSSSTSGGYSVNLNAGGEISLTDKRGRLIEQSSKHQFEQAEENSDGGFDILVNTPKRGIDNYTVRHFDDAGSATGKTSKIGTSETALVDWEDDFEVDLNGDTIIGHTLTEIESVGDVTLSSLTSGGYSLNDSGAGEIDLKDGRGRSIVQQGNFSFLHAEENSGGGYDVLVNSPRRGVDSYSVRHFDSTGQEDRKATTIGMSESRLVDWEDNFEVDLNGDSAIGHAYSSIEANGDVVLSLSTSGGYVVNYNSGGEIELANARGLLITQNSRHDFMHAEEDSAGGFNVLVRSVRAGKDSYVVRHFDATGQEKATATKLGTDAANLVDWEDDFEADLNGDLTIGHALNMIEDDGDVVLSSSTSGGYSVNHSNAGEITLTDSRGRIISQGTLNSFEHAEEDGQGGFYLLFNQPRRGDDYFSVRYFDSTGAESGRATVLGAVEASLVDWEDEFEVDLNGDLTIGHTLTAIESIGDVVLSATTFGTYSVSQNGGAEIELQDSRGRQIQQSSRYDYQHAEESGDGGFDVLVRMERRGDDFYTVRHFDSAGVENARATTLGASEADLIDWEDNFEVDLNGDLSIGHVYTTIESDGDVALSTVTTGGYSINYSGTGDIDLMDRRGRLIEQKSNSQFEHAEENSDDGGYYLLFNQPRQGAENYSIRYFADSGYETQKATKIGGEEALSAWETVFQTDFGVL